jgi:hypothetical protein
MHGGDLAFGRVARIQCKVFTAVGKVAQDVEHQRHLESAKGGSLFAQSWCRCHAVTTKLNASYGCQAPCSRCDSNRSFPCKSALLSIRTPHRQCPEVPCQPSRLVYEGLEVTTDQIICQNAQELGGKMGRLG